MVNKTLQQFIDSIYAEKNNLAKKIDAEKDAYKKHDLQFEFNTVMDEKFNNVYYEMINNIPEDKYAELKSVIEDLLGSEKDYERLEGKVATTYPHPTPKQVSLGVSMYMVAKNFDKVIENLSNLVSDETMNKVASDSAKYVPSSINNNPIHPLNKTIEDIKNGDKFSSLSAQDKLKVSKELDEINEVVKESPRRFSEAQTNFDTDYERIMNADNAEFFKNYVTNENKEFGKAYTYKDLNLIVKDDVADDQEKIDIAKSPSFKLTKETQDSILKVWKKMDELNIISAGDGRETGGKIYGFAKLYEAREKINNALKTQQFDNLENLKNEYEKQVQNVREMYKIIKEELNPSPDRIPGNVQNFRENFVPAEFKNDICINATFNGMYNAYSIVKSLGVDAEEFLKNPQHYVDQNFNKELTRFHIDTQYKDLSFDETLARVYSDTTKAGLNVHGMPRMVSTLNFFEKNDEQRKNNLIFAAVQTGKIERIYDDEQVSYNYFSKGRTNSFVNLLFANPEDKNFEKMMSHDSVTSDKFHKIKAFDFANYLKEKNITSDVINDRIINFLTTAYQLSVDSEKKYNEDKKQYDKQLREYKEGKIKNSPERPKEKIMTIDNFAHMVKDIQQGIIAYVMLSNPEKFGNMDKLIDILRNPAEALKNLNLSDDCVQKLAKLNNKDVLLNEYKQLAQTESSLNIENIRLSENAYNKTVEKILKEANKISEKVISEKDAKKVEELQKQSVLKMNELKELQKVETERLNEEYKLGNIPSEYYQKRVENILSLNHNEKIAIFDDGLDKKAYIKSTGLEQLTKSEINKLYECEIAKQKIEKEIFINKQFLQNKKLISTNREIEGQKANFTQIDINQIESVAQNVQRQSLIVDDAKIEKSNEKSEPHIEIDPKQTVKMP